MARIRYVKPTFFENAALGQLKPLARLLFIGMWCWADRDGRLLDRPALLKEALLPFDKCSAEALLASLAAAGFIERYDAGGKHLIQIVNWHHQRPHIKEPASLYPPPSGEMSAEISAEHCTLHQPLHLTEPRGGRGKVEGGLGIGKVEPDALPEPLPLDALVRCVRSFDALTGRLTGSPTLQNQIEKWLDKFDIVGADPAKWFDDACQEAARNSAPKMGYVMAILDRWQREGRQSDRRSNGRATTPVSSDPF